MGASVSSAFEIANPRAEKELAEVDSDLVDFNDPNNFASEPVSIVNQSLV